MARTGSPCRKKQQGEGRNKPPGPGLGPAAPYTTDLEYLGDVFKLLSLLIKIRNAGVPPCLTQLDDERIYQTGVLDSPLRFIILPEK